MKVRLVVKDAPQEEPPLLVCFPNGLPPPDVLSAPAESQKALHFSFHRSTDVLGPKSHQRTLVAETDAIEYRGSNFGPETPVNVPCKYIVGIRKRKSDEMQIVEAPNLFRLRQAVKCQQASADAGTAEAAGTSTRQQQFKRLTEEFGSKKARRRLSAKERGQMVDEETEKELAQLTGNQEPEREKQAFKTAQEEFECTGILRAGLPPYDPSGKTPHDVYKLEDLVSKTELDGLEERHIKILLDCSSSAEKVEAARSSNMWPEYVLDRAQRLRANLPAHVQKAALLVYWSHLWLFYMRSDKARDTPEEYASKNFAPMITVQKLFATFTDQERNRTGTISYFQPKSKKDLLLSYMLALALIIDDFSSEPALIVRDVGIQRAKLLLHFRNMGCIIKCTGRKKGAEDPGALALLQVPLVFPPPRKNAKRR